MGEKKFGKNIEDKTPQKYNNFIDILERMKNNSLPMMRIDQINNDAPSANTKIYTDNTKIYTDNVVSILGKTNPNCVSCDLDAIDLSHDFARTIEDDPLYDFTLKDTKGNIVYVDYNGEKGTISTILMNGCNILTVPSVGFFSVELLYRNKMLTWTIIERIQPEETVIDSELNSFSPLESIHCGDIIFKPDFLPENVPSISGNSAYIYIATTGKKLDYTFDTSQAIILPTKHIILDQYICVLFGDTNMYFDSKDDFQRLQIEGAPVSLIDTYVTPICFYVGERQYTKDNNTGAYIPMPIVTRSPVGTSAVVQLHTGIESFWTNLVKKFKRTSTDHD